MSRCPHILKQIVGSKVSGPHCSTCCCPCEYQEALYEVTSCASCSCETTTTIFEPVSERCVCDCHAWKDECHFCLHSKTPFSYTNTENWDRFLSCSNRTYTILRHWFKRFDRNEDGYLDFNELKILVQELGTESLQNTQIDRLLHKADSNRDGRLSFIEYLRMWEDAALNELEFLNVTNCREINTIIREYNLFPEERRARTTDVAFTQSSKLASDIFHSQYAIEPTICDCGDEEVKLFVDPNSQDDFVELDQEQKIDEELPVLSKNRSPVSSPKYNSED